MTRLRAILRVVRLQTRRWTSAELKVATLPIGAPWSQTWNGSAAEFALFAPSGWLRRELGAGAVDGHIMDNVRERITNLLLAYRGVLEETTLSRQHHHSHDYGQYLIGKEAALHKMVADLESIVAISDDSADIHDIITDYVAAHRAIPAWMEDGTVTTAYRAVVGAGPDLNKLLSGQAVWDAAYEAARKEVDEAEKFHPEWKDEKKPDPAI
jgi:hypothetical protein